MQSPLSAPYSVDTARETDAPVKRIQELQKQIETLQSEVARLETELNNCRLIKEESEWFFENSLDMLVIHNNDGQLERVSPSAERVLGFTPDELILLPLDELVHPDDLQRTIDHLATEARGARGTNFVCRCKHKDGEWRWLSWTTTVLRNRSEGAGRLYGAARDITLSKLTEQELLHKAQHDSLTGLANRARFDQALEQALARAGRNGRQIALLLIDLDGFKTVNDTFGHTAGDHVLKTVAARLSAIQRQGDSMARLGGDEFACLMEDISAGAPDAVAARIVDIVCEPIDIGTCTVKVGCSIGIAIWSGATSGAQTIYEQADRAMYQVKANGKCGFAHHASSNTD